MRVYIYIVFILAILLNQIAFSERSETTTPYDGAPLPLGGTLGWSNHHGGAENQLFEPSRTTSSEMGKALQRVIGKLPESDLKRGLTKYVGIIGLQTYLSDSGIQRQNKGVAAYMSKNFSEGDCFQTLVKAFYKEIKIRDGKQKPSVERKNFFEGRPSLADKAGAGSHRDVSKGWLWKTAMRHTKNNSNLAMALIATCGHDDTGQGNYSWVDSSIDAKEELKKTINANKDGIKKLQEEIGQISADDEKLNSIAMRLSQLISHNNFLKEQTGVQRYMACPSNQSKMYLPESLGEGVDIPESLKNKISSVQAPTKGAQVLPAKHYHVYGGAFMACQLIQEGISPDKAIFMQKQAARFYRGIRMCEMTKNYGGRREKLVKQYDKYKANFKPKPLMKKETAIGTRVVRSSPLDLEQFVIKESIRLSKSGECIPPEFTGGVVKTKKNPSNIYNADQIVQSQKETDTRVKVRELCSLLGSHIGLHLFDPDIDEKMITSKLKVAFEKMNAAYLYQKWYVGGGKLFGMNIPCTDFRMFGPSSLTGLSNISRRGKASRCIPEFSAESCQKAKNRLATWDADFEWTISQHEVGAKFAAEKCKKNEDNKSLNDMACETNFRHELRNELRHK